MPRSKTPNKLNAILLTLCLLWLSSATFASMPPAFLVTPEQTSNRITIYSEYLADPAEQLRLEDLLSGDYDDQFTPATRTRERLGYDVPVWWIRVALENSSDQPQTRILDVTPGHFASLTLFEPKDGGYVAHHSGSNISPPWADVRDRRQLHEITLPPFSTALFYLRAAPSGSMNYSLFLNTPLEQIAKNQSADLPFLLFGGVLLGLLIFNAGQYYFSRNRAQLDYLLTQSSILLVVFAAAGFISIEYLPMAGMQIRLELLGVIFAYAFSLYFTRSFLCLAELDTRLDIGLRLCGWFCFLIALLSLSLPSMLASQLIYGVVMVITVPLIYAGIRAVQIGTPQAQLYLVARSGMAMAAVLISLNTFDVLSTDLELPLILLMAALVEGILFTFGLSRQRELAVQSDLHTRQQKALEESTWQTRSDTLARVSHEIRTPMSGILGMAELLTDTPLTPNQKECVRSIRSAGENLLRIINDVLEYSRLETGTTDVNRERFDISTLVMDALELFRERAEEKQIELIAHIHTNVPTQVFGDHGKLRQVLTNLLGACIRHTSSGELVLDVSRDPSGLADHLRFEFEGSAMKQIDAQLNSFADDSEPVNEADSTTLGLSIVRQLVSAMDGKCGLREGRRQNLVCWVTLPLPGVPLEPGMDIPVDTTLLAGHSMLVVDDSSTVTRVIRQQALSWGMRVTVCHDPREALATIRTQANLNEPFDVVLLDHQMPGINGMQLATRIHEDNVITHPLVLVMLTGVADAPTSTMARNVGIHKVLTKPVSGQRLKQALAEALGMLVKRAPLEESRAPRQDLRILVAEDHLLSQKVIRGMLGKLGLKADIVANGSEAVTAVRDGDYEIVLMDCEMPVVDGFEATRQIREWEKNQQRSPIPIIALTAHILREHRERSLASGMNAHVPKPIEIGALSDVIVRFTSSADAPAPDSPRANGETPE